MTNALPVLNPTRHTSEVLIVGTGEYKVSSNREACISTYALGSCIGLTAYDPLHKVGGLLHYMLPSAPGQVDPRHGARYLDMALPAFVSKLLNQGAEKKFLEFKAFGAAVCANLPHFDVPARNIAALKEITLRERLFVKVWEVGGKQYRTISLSIRSGQVLVRTATDSFYR